MVTEKTKEEINKALEVVGHDVYVIETILHDKPLIKRIHISSFECRGSCVKLKTDNEGSYISDGI